MLLLLNAPSGTLFMETILIWLVFSSYFAILYTMRKQFCLCQQL